MLLVENIESRLIYRHGPDWIGSPLPLALAVGGVYAGHCLACLVLAVALTKAAATSVVKP